MNINFKPSPAFAAFAVSLALLAVAAFAFAEEPQLRDVTVPHLKLDNTVGTLVVESQPDEVPVVCIEDQVDEETAVLSCLIIVDGERAVMRMPFRIEAKQ